MPPSDYPTETLPNLLQTPYRTNYKDGKADKHFANHSVSDESRRPPAGVNDLILAEQEVPFVYEPVVFVGGFRMRLDFYLPGQNIYYGHFGRSDGNVRLRHGDPVAFERPRFLFHGTADVRAGAERGSQHHSGPGRQETGGENLKSELQFFINQRPLETEAAFFVPKRIYLPPLRGWLQGLPLTAMTC